MKTLLNDTKYSLRVLAKSVGFTTIALVTVALSVGAATAVFSVVNAIMLKPLPYPQAERLVIPWRLAPKELNLGYEEIPWGVPAFQRIIRDTHVFQNIAAFKGDSVNLTGAGRPILLEGARVSAGFFSVLGVQPIIGRTFTPQEDVPGREHEAVLSYDVWRDQFLASKEILGRNVNLNGQLYAVVGVMPPGFAFPRGEEMPGSFGFPRRTRIWTLLAAPAVTPLYAPDELAIIARLKPGISIAKAQAEMEILKPRLEQDVPGGKGSFNSRITSLSRQVAGDTRTPLLLTLAAIGIVLLITCSNVANLVLARSLARSTEFSLRVALGSSRARLVVQLMTESLIVAVAGGLLGILLADQGIRVLKVLGPPNVPRLQEAGLDLRVLAFAIGTTLISGVLFGLAPALAASRQNLAQQLRAGSRGSGGNRKVPAIRSALLIVEVALALVLVIASALMGQTFFRLLSVDPGFMRARVLTFELSLPTSTYKDDDQMVALYQRALQQLRFMPGAESVGITEMVPMGGAADGGRIRVPGRIAPRDQYPMVNYTIASSGYFSAVGTPILRGRSFLDSDTAHSAPVVIINRTLARTLGPGRDPVGKQVALAGEDYPLMTVVGVAQDIKHLSLREDPGPEIYVPFTQKPFPSMRLMHLVVRTKGAPVSLTASVQSVIRSLDPDLPVAHVTTLEAIVDESVAGQRFSMMLLGAFAGLSLILAACGMYGVISYSVNQRTRELGVRMALGADRQTVLRMVVGQGVRLAALGIVVGLLTAIGCTRVMASFLYGVHPTDTLTFATVAASLLMVAAVACYLPARRATNVDPMIALRYE